MAKYTTDLKLSVIAHCQSNHSYKRTARHFGLDHKTVELLIKLYQTHDIKRRSTKAIYDTTFKLDAVQQVILGKSSHQLAIELNISNHSLLLNWLKSYQAFGIMGLEPKPKGRKTMSNKHNVNQNKSKLQDDYCAKLLKRLAYLETENDYLKKLDASIRQKQQTKNK